MKSNHTDCSFSAMGFASRFVAEVMQCCRWFQVLGRSASIVSCRTTFMIGACILTWQSSSALGQSRPNIVYFLVDDMGWMDCGAYGSKYYETPNIDRFAQRAMRFTNAYSQPLCSPTRASLMTGQYSARHRITSATGHLPPQPVNHVFLQTTGPADSEMLLPESKNYLEPSQITLAETLKTVGYRTAHIGKWHLGLTQPHWPESQGFDATLHCHPDPGPPGGYFSPYGVQSSGNPTGARRVGNITDGSVGEYIVDRQAAEAVKFIQTTRGQPFFLNLWCYGVHGPWGHKSEYTQQFLAKKDPTGRQRNPLMASMLRSVDECFGRILDELDRQNLTSNTIIVFNSDNGGNVHSNVSGTAKTAKAEKAKDGMLADWRKWAGDQPPTNNAPLRDGKGTLYEGGTRVPLMWAWADKIQAGSTNDSVVGPIDVYPTLLSLLDIDKPARQSFDGKSYSQVLLGRGRLDRTAYFNYHPHAGHNRAGGVSVRSGDFKLLRWFGNPISLELYNLRDDLGESHNLVTQLPQKAAQLDSLIDDFLRDTSATYPRPNPAFRASTAANPSSGNDLDRWKQRQCVASVANGVVSVKGTAAAGTAFLGLAAGSFIGPANVKLRVRSPTGGDGKIDILPRTAADPSTVVSTSFHINPGDWQDITVELKHIGSLGTLRIYLPVADNPIEIDEIQILPAKGRPETWSF